VSPRHRRNYDRGPKYPEIPALPKPEVPALSEPDRKRLATMVRKVGLEAVIEAAKTVGPPRRAGRPSRGNKPYLELMHLADWIEDEAAERRELGSRWPYNEARIAAYRMAHGLDVPVSKSNIKLVKKKHLRGRRELELLRNKRRTFYGRKRRRKTAPA
jgi:hypothetical protein